MFKRARKTLAQLLSNNTGTPIATQLHDGSPFVSQFWQGLTLSRGTGSQTITRATTHTVQNNDGFLVTCLAGEIPIKGGRRIYNLIPAAGTGSASLAVAANKSMTLAAGTYVFSMGAGTGTATFSGTGGATGTLDASASGRVSVSKTITAGTLVVTASVATLVDLKVESVDAQTTKTAGEYVSVGVPGDWLGTEHVTNGTFATDTTGWGVINSATLASVSGELRITNSVVAVYQGAAQAVSVTAGTKYIFSITARVGTASEAFINLGTAEGGADYGQVTTTNSTNTKLTLEFTATTSTLYVACLNANQSSVTAFYDNISVKPAIYHGAGVDGVKWLSTDISGNPIATATLDGAEVWPAGTQILATADIRDMTTANWVLGATMTRARTSVGYDGAANSATRLTGGAVAATNTCYLTVTAAASSRTYSAMVKRVTGTGPVRIVQTGTETDISAQLSTTGYTLVELNASVLNVAIGFKIDTNGDAIDVDFNQFESGAYATSRMAATGAARNASVISVPTASNIASAAGFIALEYTPQHAPSGTVYLWGTYVDANNSTAILHDATNLIFRKRIAGVNYDATIANAFVSGTTYKMAASWGVSGLNIALGGTLGTPNTTGIVGVPYLSLPGSAGNYVSTPDSAAVSITGDIDIRVKAALTDWTPASNGTLVGKWGGATNSYLLRKTSTGLLMQTTGTNSITAYSTADVAFSDGSVGWVRVTIDVDNGAGGSTTTFYTSSDGTTWVQLGNTVVTAGVATINDSSTNSLEIGTYAGGTTSPLSGSIYRVQIYNGINGTLVADCNPSDYTSGGTTWTSSTTGEVYTLNGTATIWPFVRIGTTMQTGGDGNSASQPGMAIKNVYIGQRELGASELRVMSS